MQEGDFEDGLQKIRMALQVERDPKKRTSRDADNDFRPEFMKYLWGVLRKLDVETWQRAVERLCRRSGKPVDLSAGDFLDEVRGAREEEDWKRRRFRAELPSSPLDVPKAVEKVLADPSVPEASKKYAAAMGSARAAPRPAGGERYRRDDLGPAVILSGETAQVMRKASRFRERMGAILEAWPEAVGLDASRGCWPVSLRDGELTVEFESAVLRQEIEAFRKDEIILKLRAAVPESGITNLRCVIR